jgi:hypothetical protein
MALRCSCRGELPEEAAAAYERQRRAFEALQRSAAALAEALDQPLPALPESDVTRTRAAGGVTLVATRVRAARFSLRASVCSSWRGVSGFLDMELAHASAT